MKECSSTPITNSTEDGILSSEECPCIIADDQGNCIDCGKSVNESSVTAQQLRDLGVELGPRPAEDIEVPPLGDVVALHQLAHQTLNHVIQQMILNSDPLNPSQPRLRLMGGQMLRISFKDIWQAITKDSYIKAKILGYRGNEDGWRGIIKTASAIGQLADL